jgi:hypothetical protein
VKPLIDTPAQPELPDAAPLFEVPMPNRHARRAMGLTIPQFKLDMRARAADRPFPRAIRRLMRDPLKAERRIKREKARVNRALRPYGVHL